MVSREGENMSENAKLFILGLIIAVDMYIILKHEWEKENRHDH